MEPIILPRLSDQKPLVSVISITYNHEPHIRDCLEGFLMQKTSFPVEFIIHDDASTDHTADIIREYYEKRPDLFHVIIERENCYSIHKPIMMPLFKQAQGKYIALCEGDDYWIDPKKLQKQAELCEENESIVGCVSCNFIEKDGTRVLDKSPMDITIIKKDTSNLPYYHTSTFFFRSSSLFKALELYKALFQYSCQDTILFCCLSNLGDIRVIPEPLSCRRITYHGVESSLTKKQHIYNLYLKQRVLLCLFGPRKRKNKLRVSCIKLLITFLFDQEMCLENKKQILRQLFYFLTFKNRYCLTNKL